MAVADGNITATLQIEAVQTVMPTKPTDPRQSRRVSVSGTLSSGIFQSRLHMVLHYAKSSEEDFSGWEVAGWMKETLGQALAEQPLLSGRLRLLEYADAGGGLEIVSNDSGVRLVEAQISMDLTRFLDTEEGELVFWEDIEEQNPQYSPLFYVQVTNFKCGGYAVGITCSLLLADPIAITNFLKKWSNLHNYMVCKTNNLKQPLFYLPALRRRGCSAAVSSKLHKQSSTQSFIFGIESNSDPDSDNETEQISLAQLCVEETEQKLASSFALFFRNQNSQSLIPKKNSQSLKVANCSRETIMGQKKSDVKIRLVRGNWDDLGGEGISFNQGSKPVRVSYWVNSVFDQGTVMVIQASDRKEDGSELRKCIVAIPK